MKSSKPKQTESQKQLEQISIERERQLRIENARQTTKSFSDNIAFRRKLRGMFSVLSNGFKGFSLGAGGGRSSSSVGGGGSGGGQSVSIASIRSGRVGGSAGGSGGRSGGGGSRGGGGDFR